MKNSILLLSILCLFCPLLFATGSSSYEPGDQSLIFLPTAYTMPKKTYSFTNYELVFAQLAYAPTDNSHVSAFSMIPFFKEAIKSFSLGAKVKYYSNAKVSSALWTSYTPDARLFTLGNVVSFGKPSQSLHIGAAYVYSENNDNPSGVVFWGLRHDLSRKVSFLFEYANLLEKMEDDFNGLISFGLRVRSGSVAWEFGGMRPLVSDIGDDFFFFPVLKATVEF